LLRPADRFSAATPLIPKEAMREGKSPWANLPVEAA
jgi:hypothetical protein